MLSNLIRCLKNGDLQSAQNMISKMDDDLAECYYHLAVAGYFNDVPALEALYHKIHQAAQPIQRKFLPLIPIMMFWAGDILKAGPFIDSALQTLENLPVPQAVSQSLRPYTALYHLSKGKQLYAHASAAQSGVSETEIVYNFGIPYIAASVSGLAPQLFILDTGAASTVLSKRYCVDSNIPFSAETQRDVIDGAGRHLASYMTLVESLQVGMTQVKNLTATIIDFPESFNAAGIINPFDTFRGLFSEMNFIDNIFKISHSAPSTNKVIEIPIFWNEGNPFIRASVEGMPGLFLLDTGAASNIVTRSFAKSLGRWQPASPTKVHGMALSGDVLMYKGFEASLDIDGLEEAKTLFHIKYKKALLHSIINIRASGYIGLPWMKGKQIILPPDRRSIHVN